MSFQRKKIPGTGLLLAGLLLASLVPEHRWGSSGAVAQTGEVCPSPSALTKGMGGPLAHVRYLADDALQGREAGSPGARCAAEYIAGVFRSLGLEPVGKGGSYFQPFHTRMGSVLARGNELTLDGRKVELNRAWAPFGFSSDATLTAPLIYGGYGVSQPGNEEDRYAHLNLEGKIVVVEGADPHGSGGGSFAGDPHFKATVAAGRRAAGVVVLLPEGAPLPHPETENRPPVRIPAAAVAGRMAAAVREAARQGVPATLSTRLEPRMVEMRNVVALLPGAHSTLAREVVIVGAHYDHLGLGGEGSLAPDTRAVHNGADDNASGTAALMEVARALAKGPEPPARSVLFLAFTAEEKGLWGASHYVGQPLRPLENTVAMLNMDMVGRLRENTLTVYGTGTAEEWNMILEKVNGAQPQPFVLSPIPDGFGPSDHSRFYGAGVPVLHFFTNTHAEYHRPEDDWELINATGLERVAGMVTGVTSALAGTPSHPALALSPVAGTPPPHGGEMPADSGQAGAPGRGYGAYMGTIPDMTPQEFGVRITGVREGSPAEEAGLQAGDVLVEMAGQEITDLYAYTYVLREHKPGDEVTVVFLRGGERIRVTAVLGQRE